MLEYFNTTHADQLTEYFPDKGMLKDIFQNHNNTLVFLYEDDTYTVSGFDETKNIVFVVGLKNGRKELSGYTEVEYYRVKITEFFTSKS